MQRVILALAVALLVAGCGGGGGGGKTASTPRQLTNADQIYALAPTPMREAVESLADSIPNSGRVTQSTNVNDNDVTGDTASTTFDGEKIAVRIAHEKSGSTVFDSATNVALNDPAATDSPDRDNYRSERHTIGSLSGSNGRLAVVRVDWNPENAATDYLAFGYWLGVSNIGNSPTVQAGVFIDGPELREMPTVPTSGTATYEGTAQGLHTIRYSTNRIGYGPFTANATLRANFGTGMINGTIDNIQIFENRVNPQTGEVEERRDYTGHRGPFIVNLGDAPISDGTFTGDVTLSPARTGFSLQTSTSGGEWGGRFSTRLASNTDSDPRLVGGTFAAHGIVSTTGFVGYRTQWVGAFGATKQ